MSLSYVFEVQLDDVLLEILNALSESFDFQRRYRGLLHLAMAQNLVFRLFLILFHLSAAGPSVFLVARLDLLGVLTEWR